jgi:hypothetical protein
MRWLAALAIVGAAGLAGAQPGDDSTDRMRQLDEARRALDEGEFDRAAKLSTAALEGKLEPEALAAAWRVRGLALFYAGREAEAAPALLEYLKLEVDARLDPAFHTPEAVAFFEKVRTDNAVELAGYRPEPDQRRMIVALLPPFGQFQNKEPAKGWVLAGLEVSLLATNLTALALVSRWCGGDGTCGDRTDDARTARAVLLASGWTLAAVIAYGAIDGMVGYRRWQRTQRTATLEVMSLGVVPVDDDGWSAQVGLRF